MVRLQLKNGTLKEFKSLNL